MQPASDSASYFSRRICSAVLGGGSYIRLSRRILLMLPLQSVLTNPAPLAVHGGSIGYASNPRLTTEDRGTGSRHSTARPRELWTGPSTTDRDRYRRCYPRAADALPVQSVPRGDDGRFSTVATT